MTSLLPEVQVGPLTGVLMYVFIGLVIIGIIGATGIGGAVVWAVFWLIILFLVYKALSFVFGSGGI